MTGHSWDCRQESHQTEVGALRYRDDKDAVAVTDTTVAQMDPSYSRFRVREGRREATTTTSYGIGTVAAELLLGLTNGGERYNTVRHRSCRYR